MLDHWFWWLLTAACLLWYTTITVYVAVRGFCDIRNMLDRLEALSDGAGPGGTGFDPSRPDPAAQGEPGPGGAPL